jgi:biopolymer transport protein ExbB
MTTLLEYLSRGGGMMYVILAVSIVGTILFLERAFNLFMLRRLDTGAFMGSVLGHVEARRFRQAVDACHVSSRHPLVPVIRAGLLRANRREKEIERAMEKEMLSALPHLQKRVSVLGLLANTSTLLGLLGTIFGLIKAFTSVAAATAAERQQALADGISQAMYTTAFGIAVAVPLLFFHHILSSRQERITMEIEAGATGLIVALTGVVRELHPPGEPGKATQDGGHAAA